MKLSLFHHRETVDERENPFTEQMIADLALRETLTLVHRSDECTRVALSVLSEPCQTTEEIQSRQDCFRDFVMCPDALAVLRRSCGRVQKRLEAFRERRHDYLSHPYHSNSGVWLRCVKEAADLALQLAGEYRILSDELAGGAFQSLVLNNMQKALREMVDNPAYAILREELSLLAGVKSPGTTLVIRAELTGAFRSVVYCLGKIGEKGGTHPRSRVPFPQRADENREISIACKAAETSLRMLYQYLWSVCTVLSSPILSLTDDLEFLDFSLRYIQLLQTKGIGFVWPVVEEEGVTEYRGLRDIHLSLYQTSAPVPNDFSEAPLTVIMGANGSGETTFLRSIATAQLFAQAGLPVPAEAAVVGIKKRLYTHFAAGEQERGRFEEECRRLSEITDVLTASDWLLLNEPFQSTAYCEAEDLLCDLLPAFAEEGIPVVLVTHILPLKDTLEHGRMKQVGFYTSKEGFRFHRSYGNGKV